MSDDRLERVEKACDDLTAAGQKVTFDAVAEKAGVGRATLYRRRELHAVVHQHQVDATGLSFDALVVQLDQLRQGLEALAAKVRRHEEQLRKLTRPAASRRTG